MRYCGFNRNFPNLFLCLNRIDFPALILILFSCFSAPVVTAQSENNPEIKKLVKQATKLTRSGSLEQSEALLHRAIELDDNRTDLKLELAFVFNKQRRIREAYDICYAVAKAEPQNSHAFAVLGVTLLTAGRFDDARLVLFNAIKMNRKEHLAWAAYGMLDFYENRIDDSLANLHQAVHYEPNEPDYLFSLAQVSARSENYREAAEAYDRFLHLPNNADADRRARIKGLIEFLRYLGDISTLYAPNGSLETSIPFELVNNRPIVKLRINGSDKPLNFVLDTGSGISVISLDSAKRLKVKSVAKGGFARGLGGDGKFEINYGILREINIGAVGIRNVPVYLRKFHTDGQAIDGYIGLALISKFLTTIDYGNRSFSLTRKDVDAKEFRDNGALSLPLRLTSSGFLSGEVLLKGIETPLNFIVDTGASISVISAQVAKTDGITPFANEERLRVIGSAGVTEDVQSFHLPLVTFGSHSRKNITAVALDLDLINEASGFEQSGILGGNFLKDYRLTFDFKNSKVTFVLVRPEKD
ncbi:MAG: aspartyl protease family protein [Pyrinomonadaceae bacterium]